MISPRQRFRQIFETYRKASWMLKIRMVLVYVIVLFSYIATVYLLFAQKEILRSMPYLLLFFAAFHFAFLEVRNRGRNLFFFVFTIVTIIELFIFGLEPRQIPASIIIFNVGCFVLGWWLDGETSEKRTFSSRSYFMVGGYVFTVFSTVAYSLFLIGWKHHLELSCNVIQETSSKFIDTLASPFVFGWKEVKLLKEDATKTKEKVDNFFSINVQDVLEFGSQVEVGEDIILTWESRERAPIFATIKTKFNNIKSNINTAIDENLKINLWICDLVLGKITDVYNHPAFQFSIVLLLFLLLTPFIRLAFFVISLLAFVLFKILFWLKVYRIHKVKQEVDEIW